MIENESEEKKFKPSEDLLIIAVVGFIWLVTSLSYGFLGMSMPDASFVWGIGSAFFLGLTVILFLIESRLLKSQPR